MEILNKIIFKIHNYIYANEGLSNSETLNEFLKIFYCKILDEQSQNKLFEIKNDHDIINHIKSLYSTLKKRLNILNENEKIELKNETILFIINELKHIKLSSYNSDIKGHILQRIIDRSYRESRGQFFTPPQVVDFIVKMIEPKKNEKGCDPASGTGGFMFSALEFINKNNKLENKDLNNIFFYDISDNLIKLIAMRMMFEFSSEFNNYFVKNSITETFDQKFDYILTNPPFGTQGKIVDKKILSQYELGMYEKSQVPDILFVEKVIQLLNNNGRAAIVLPYGDFENHSLDYFRKYLINNVKIEAIISLPDGTFIPYGTGIKSSILFIKKIQNEELEKEIINNYKVFYGKITKLGYTFSKHSKDDLNAEGLPIEDYNEIVYAYKNKSYSDKAYLIGINTILQNNKYILSENFYSPTYSKVISSIQTSNYSKLKDLVEFKYKKIKIEQEKMYDYIEITDVNAYTSEIINSNSIIGEDLPSRASYMLDEFDIIVATSGNSIGTIKQAKAIVPKQYSGNICTNGFTVFKAKNISPYYLLKFFSTDNFYKQMLKYKCGTAIPTISREDFENILVPIPEKEEIIQIENNIKKAIELRNEAIRLMNL